MTGLPMHKILVVDDEFSIRESFTLILEGKYKVVTAASGEGALKTITDQKIDLAFLDIRMPGMDGLETLKRMKEIDPELEVVMVTAVNDVQKASAAIKLGAREYLIKPFDVDAVLKIADSILRRKVLIREGMEVQKEAHKKSPQFIGQNEKILAGLKTIEKIADKNLRVLILGEAGVEKEAVAEIIHENSTRSTSPFLIFHLSEVMSAAEIKLKLFGKGKGTTVVDLQKTPGMFEAARGGTIFLNNIEHLPAELISLLPADVRLIAGSSRENLLEVSKENFDCFSEVIIDLPALRERISDLPLLANYFLRKYSDEHGRETPEIAPASLEALSNYCWPGNVAELEALVEKMVITVPSGQITPSDLPVDLLLNSSGSPGSEYISTFDQEYKRRILEYAGNNREKAAAILGINSSLL